MIYYARRKPILVYSWYSHTTIFPTIQTEYSCHYFARHFTNIWNSTNFNPCVIENFLISCIISSDEDPSLWIESLAIINLGSIPTKIIVIAIFTINNANLQGAYYPVFDIILYIFQSSNQGKMKQCHLGFEMLFSF